jgi:hypothetical protein
MMEEQVTLMSAIQQGRKQANGPKHLIVCRCISGFILAV